MIRVAANLLWLVPGEVGGSETYLLRQLAPLASGFDDIDLRLYGLPALRQAYPDLAGVTSVAPVSGASRPLRIAAETTWLRVAARSADVVHHGGGMVPLMASAPCVVTIHDVQYLTYPETFSRLKLAYLRAMTPRSARTAAVVLVPSEYVASCLIERFALEPENVRVVPHGLPRADRPSDDEVAEVLRRHRVRPPYVLYPAISYPHKNHALLIHVLAGLPADFSVVLTGSSWPAGPDLERLAIERGVEGRLRHLGRVPYRDLEALYAGAHALTFPSRYEGFGAPVVEAMALGCPVLAANTTALPEVVGDAGILLPPDNVEAWVDAIQSLDPGARSRLIDAGRRRIAGLTDLRSAEVVARAYRDAAA